ncbi:helix-turn-helix domain-containing protein [Hydrogenophaga sp.]|uniref:helix-turn-helix domain-containing protein n=1 Tax=Hydrogenophaga sp. TaxID=1904254 RepID=UPI0025BAD273|nr:helix-turn-helix domain-containing protein [Hydrogenophaga sp.]
MSTFAESFKREIARVARKELREEITALRKSAAAQRTEVSALKKQISGLQSQVKKLSKVQGAQPKKTLPLEALAVRAEQKGKPGRKAVFTAERLKTNRARLGFTQDQMARLLEVSALSIWKWESGGAAPRASRVPQILQRLALGKREALTLITEVE